MAFRSVVQTVSALASRSQPFEQSSRPIGLVQHAIGQVELSDRWLGRMCCQATLASTRARCSARLESSRSIGLGELSDDFHDGISIASTDRFSVDMPTFVKFFRLRLTVDSLVLMRTLILSENWNLH